MIKFLFKRRRPLPRTNVNDLAIKVEIPADWKKLVRTEASRRGMSMSRWCMCQIMLGLSDSDRAGLPPSADIDRDLDTIFETNSSRIKGPKIRIMPPPKQKYTPANITNRQTRWD